MSLFSRAQIEKIDAAVKRSQRTRRRSIYLEQSVAEMLRQKHLCLYDEECQKLREMVRELLEDTSYAAESAPPFSDSDEFDPHAESHVKWLCYDWLKLCGGKKDDTGEKTLRTFELPVTDQILKCRAELTLIDRFITKIPKNSSPGDRIRFMKNIPSGADDIRHMFRATPGYVLLTVSYSLPVGQVVPYVSQYENMIRTFAREHGYVETMLGRRRYIPDMKLPEFEFAPLRGYGCASTDSPHWETPCEGIPQGLQERLSQELTSYEYYGQVAKRSKELYEEEHIKVINNRYRISEAAKQAVDSVIQGNAEDIAKMAMLKAEEDEGWQRQGGRVLAPIHHELLAEIPTERWEEGKERLYRIAREVTRLAPIPLKCAITATYRWHGLEYPCPYQEPVSIDRLQTPSEINWILYHLTEIGYDLPAHKDASGDKPKGDAEHGISGIMSTSAWDAIQDYCRRYGIAEKDFIPHIRTKVHTGYVP